jgi:hypothetical protein
MRHMKQVRVAESRAIWVKSSIICFRPRIEGPSAVLDCTKSDFLVDWDKLENPAMKISRVSSNSNELIIVFI